MSTQIGIGFSQKPNTIAATQEAAIQAKRQAQSQVFDFVLVFATIQYVPTEIIHTLRQNFKKAKIIGCSTAGVILPERIEHQGIVCLAIKSTVIKFGTGAIQNISNKDPLEAGKELAKSVTTDFGYDRRQALLVLANGLSQNTTGIIDGLREALGPTLPFIGASSCDDFQFSRSFHIFQDGLLNDGCIALLLGRQLRMGLGIKHGWNPLGKPRYIDESHGNIIKKIEGKRAIHIYEEYFGKEARNLNTKILSRMAMLYPLGIYIETEGVYLLRYVLDVLEDGSLVCQGDIPQNCEAHIMIGNKDSYKQAAAEAAQEALHSLLGKTPNVFLIFESLTRNKLLGKSALLEVQIIRETLGYTTPMLGMYSFGEISPLKSYDFLAPSFLQNNMISIFAML